MKRLANGILCAVVLGVFALPGSAEAQFGADQKYIGAHVGLSGVGSAAAFGINGEFAYNDRIGIGAWIDTWSFGDSFASAGGVTSWDLRYVAIAGTGAYHFPVPSTPKLDPFLGVAVGYFVVSSESQAGAGVTFTGDASRAFVGGYGGVRYFFAETVTGVARLGVGASYLTLGFDVKL